MNPHAVKWVVKHKSQNTYLFTSRSWRDVLDTTLCDKVCQ